ATVLPTADDKTGTNPLNIQTTVAVLNEFRSLPDELFSNHFIDDPLPQAGGHQFLCVIGGTGTRWGDRWQSIDHPTIATVLIRAQGFRAQGPILVHRREALDEA